MLARDEIVGEADDDRNDARKEFACDQACHRRLHLASSGAWTVTNSSRVCPFFKLNGWSVFASRMSLLSVIGK